jgi:hypothetical protein
MRFRSVILLLALLLVAGVAQAAPAEQQTQATAQITSFTSSATAVDRTALNNRTARIPVSWTTSNRPDSANLVFEQVMPDGRVFNVELPRPNPWVASNGDGVVSPFPPGGDATSVVLQVRLVDAVKITVLDQKTITIPIGTATQITPTIRSFTSSAANVGRNALNARTARVSVSWQVDNRPANSNLLFEQVLADGSSVNVELPRQNPIVPSSGNGTAAPIPPGGSTAPTSVILRLRVIDLTSQQTLVQKDLTLPIADNDVPTIATFTTTATTVYRADLNNRTARIPVSWSVNNRPDGTNLVFEQVLDNGSVVNVELPRQNPIVPSSGNGVAAAVNPGTGTTVKLQVRLINLSNQAELAKKELTLTINDTAPTYKIDVFTTSAASVARDQLNARTARVPVTWAVYNRPPNSNLVFEQVLDNGTVVNVELPRNNPFVASEGNGVTAPVNPGSSTALKLQVRLIDTTNQAELAKNQLTINIVESSTAPRITLFNTTAASVTIADLNAKTARIPVSWNVDNRPANTNLVFEQVLSNGSAVNVELPRQNPIVSSSGNGVTAPVAPGGAMAVVQLRLRLVNLNTSATIDSKDITVPISGISGTTPAPAVTLFTATPSTAEPGDTVTLAWEVTNANSVTITQVGASDFAPPNPAATTGSIQVTVPSDASGSITYELTAKNAAGQEALKQVIITVTGSSTGGEATPEPEANACPFDTSLADTCPVSQEIVNASYQPFQSGFMVWNGDSGMIYVLYQDGTWEEFTDTWIAGDPELPVVAEQPPSGMFVPLRGFGKVWSQNNGQTQLGWATADESSYQATWEMHPLTDADQTVNTPHFTLPDGRVIHLGLIWSVG